MLKDCHYNRNDTAKDTDNKYIYIYSALFSLSTDTLYSTRLHAHTVIHTGTHTYEYVDYIHTA